MVAQMEDNEIAVIVGVEAQGPGKAIISGAETRTSQNARRTRRDMDQRIQRLEEQLDNSFISKNASHSGTPQTHGKQEITRIRELILRSGAGSSGVESPRPEKSNLNPPQTVYCVSNHITKATFHSPSTSEQVSGSANSTSTDILPYASWPVRSKTSTTFSTILRSNTPTFASASTPCLPASSLSSTINAVPGPGVSTPPTSEITHSRTSSSTSALSFFRSLKSALKGKEKAKDKHRTLGFPLEFIKPSTASTSKSTHTIATSLGKTSIHLPLSSIFHGLRHGFKPTRSPSDEIVRMLPPPVIELHKPSLSPSPVPPPLSKVKRKRDLWRNIRIGSSFSKNAISRTNQRVLLEDEDASAVLDLGHIPLPSPLLYETYTLLPPNPDPKYTVTIHLMHPGQKVEYEMDNMTGHLLIMIYTPHCGFSAISGIVGGGSSRPAASGYDNYDDDYYGYETASCAGGIWIPQQFDWNGLRVRDWGAVSGKVVFQFPEYVRLGRGGEEEWGEREVMPPDMGEEVIELELDDGDLDVCVIKEGKWDEKGKGKGKAAPQTRMGSKRKEKCKETSSDGNGMRGKPASRYDLRQRS